MSGLIDLASLDDAALAAIGSGGGGGGLTRTAVKTSAYTASSGDLIPVDTTSGNVTVTLPTAPADKAKVTVKHIIQGGTNTVTVACGGSDVLNKTGGNTTATLTLVNQGATYEYQASTHIWTVTGSDLPLSQLDARYVLTPTATKTAAYTALAGDLVRADATSTAREVYDAVTTNASATLTSATAAFTAADVGAPISGLGIAFAATILSVQSSTSVTLSANATATATAVTVGIGTGILPITLPAAAATGATVAVKKTDTTGKLVRVLPAGSDTIDGAATFDIGPGRTVTFRKDSATTWLPDTRVRVAAGAIDYTPGNIVNVIGDSISPQQSTTAPIRSGNGTGKTDFLHWAHLLSNGRVLSGRPGGIGSQRIDMMTQRIYADTLSEGGHWCLIQTGTNDASFGHTAATYATYIKALVASVLAAGQRPILTTPVPNGTTATRLRMDQYRRFILSYANANGYPVVDFWSVLVNPLTGAYQSGLDSGDGVHPNVTGYKAMGQAIVDALTPYLVPSAVPLPQVNASTDNPSLLTNGLFLTDTNSDGVPDGWTKSGTQTYSLVTGDATIVGSALRIQDSSSSGFSQVSSGILSGTSTGMAGHRVAFTGRIKVTGTSGQVSFVCNLNSAAAGAVTVVLRAVATWNSIATPGWQTFYLEGTCPSDCNGVSVILSSNGGTGVDAQVAQVGVYDLTAWGL